MMNLCHQGWAFRHRGAIGIVFVLPAAVLVAFSKPLIAEDTWPDIILDALAWASFFTGAAFRFWSTLYVGARKRETLVMEGPYSMRRNPLYFGSFLLAVSAGLFLKHFTLAFGIGLTALFYMQATVPDEERVLREKHREAYNEYCLRVPRFWPRISLFHTPDAIEVRVKGLRIELKRCLVWMWLPFVGEAIAHLRGEPWWPLLFYLP